MTSKFYICPVCGTSLAPTHLFIHCEALHLPVILPSPSSLYHLWCVSRFHLILSTPATHRSSPLPPHFTPRPPTILRATSCIFPAQKLCPGVSAPSASTSSAPSPLPSRLFGCSSPVGPLLSVVSVPPASVSRASPLHNPDHIPVLYRTLHVKDPMTRWM